jgi:hypothetical protein
MPVNGSEQRSVAARKYTRGGRVRETEPNPNLQEASFPAAQRCFRCAPPVPDGVVSAMVPGGYLYLVRLRNAQSGGNGDNYGWPVSENGRPGHRANLLPEKPPDLAVANIHAASRTRAS